MPSHTRARIGALSSLLLAPFLTSGAQAVSLDELARRFAASDFVFNRSRSDIPFVPLAWLDVSTYQESRFLSPSGAVTDSTFRQSTLSEATLLPMLLGRRDALLLGQWASWTRLTLSSSKETDVFSMAVPLGWGRQATPDWQLAAFVAPVANLNDGSWSWDYMGGVFARYLHSTRYAWLFGFYVEIAPPQEFYVPYVGLTWTIDRHWTLSAVMPWPAVLFSPTPDWLVRLGLAPSTASWSADIAPPPGNAPRHVRINFTTWDFGLRVEKRAWRSVWVGAEAGVSGLRGFTFAGGDWQGPNSDLGAEGYASLTVNFRPAVAARSQ